MPTARIDRLARRLTSVLAVLTLIGFFAVNTIGFVDTETGSAFGCGHQWPLCNGAVLPSHWGLKTIIEFSHRGLVGLATVLLLALLALVWWRYRQWVEARVLMILSLVFVVIEAGLGALGVKFSDPPFELAFHFGISLLAFNSILLLVLEIRYIDRAMRTAPQSPTLRGETPRAFRIWTVVAVIYTYVAMYLGAYVASSGDGHLFRGWPLPTESWHTAGTAMTVDWLHRMVALGLLLLAIWLCKLAGQTRGSRPDLFFGSLATLALVCIQALTGALLIATHIAMFAFLLHVTVVTFLFAAICYLMLQVLPEPRRQFASVAGAEHGDGDDGPPAATTGVDRNEPRQHKSGELQV